MIVLMILPYADVHLYVRTYGVFPKTHLFLYYFVWYSTLIELCCSRCPQAMVSFVSFNPGLFTHSCEVCLFQLVQLHTREQKDQWVFLVVAKHRINVWQLPVVEILLTYKQTLGQLCF